MRKDTYLPFIQLKIGAEKKQEDEVMSKILNQKTVFCPITFKRTGKFKGSEAGTRSQRSRRYSLDSLAANSIMDKHTIMFDMDNEGNGSPEARFRKEEVGLKESLIHPEDK
jgi:hypothetical protein